MEFKITIINWDKHNSKVKKGYPYFMLSKRILNDEKIAQLTANEFVLFVHCLCVACDWTSQDIQISSTTIPKQLRMGPTTLEKGLRRLEQIQLVTISKKQPLNRIEENRIEKNRIEGASNSKSEKSELTLFEPPEKPSRPPKATAPDGVNLVIKFYCDTWREVYRAERSPDIRGKDAGMLKTLTKDLGKDRAMELVKAYLEMRDSWFLTKRHDVPTLMQNLNAISLFAQNGQSITRAEISQIDKNQTMQNTLDAIRRGEV